MTDIMNRTVLSFACLLAAATSLACDNEDEIPTVGAPQPDGSEDANAQATSAQDTNVQDAKGPPLPEGYSWELKGYKAEKWTVDEGQDSLKKTENYFARCDAALGSLPKGTVFNCEDAQEMPVDGLRNGGESIPRPSGTSVPEGDLNIASCDRPSLIYRDMHNIGCSKGSRIKRVSHGNTDWVYICRKGHSIFEDENIYSEVGLIGHNRTNGKTCFYAGRRAVTLELEPRETEEKSAKLFAVLGKDMRAPSGEDELSVKNWGIPGDDGCTRCHSHGPWLNFPFVDGRDGYSDIRVNLVDGGKGLEECKPKDPKEGSPLPGYYEDDFRPVVPTRHPGMLYEPIYPAGGKNHLAKRLLPTVEGAGMCTTCHHIGDGSYANRYPRAVFAMRKCGDPTDRIDLYLGNVSEWLQGSHLSRADTQVWHQLGDAKIHGFGEQDNQYVDKEALSRAMEAIDECYRVQAKKGKTEADKQKEEACWGSHWTSDTLKADPEGYVVQTCQHCHNGDKKQKTDTRLTTSDQVRNKKAEICAKLNPIDIVDDDEESDAPVHPPSGKLEQSVIDILVGSDGLKCPTYK